MGGESKLKKFVSHRVLYFLGFLTGWNDKIVSLELLPIAYFLIWTIILFSLGVPSYGWLFLVSGILLTTYFVILHTAINPWDKIKRWFICRARERGGIKEMTVRDIKYLLLYTRKVFGVKPTVQEVKPGDKKVSATELRRLLITNRRWLYFLNGIFILEFLLVTFGGVMGYIYNLDLLAWLANWWFLIFIGLFPIIIAIIMISVYKRKIRILINQIPADDFEEILTILNEYEIFKEKD